MESPEYCEINSNTTLDYINRLLMEEGTDEKASIYQQLDALQAIEKPFYDIVGQTYPSSPKETMISRDTQVDCPQDNYSEQACSGSFFTDILGPQGMHLVANDGASECDHLSLQFERGAEEANKFVPSIVKLVDLDSNDHSDSNQIIEATIGQKGKHVSKIQSHPHVDLEFLEARNSKHLAISVSETTRDEMFDSVLLCDWQFHLMLLILEKLRQKKQTAVHRMFGEKDMAKGR